MTDESLAQILGVTVEWVREKALKQRWSFRHVLGQTGEKTMDFYVHKLPEGFQRVIAAAEDREKAEKKKKILAAMGKKGLSQTDIARQLRLRVQSVSHVIAGRATSRRIVNALVKAGVPKELFPSYKL